MRLLLSFLLVLFVFASCSKAGGDSSDSNGLIIKKSANNVEVTKQRLIGVLEKLKDKGLSIGLEWSHSTKAMNSKSQIKLGKTELVIFGNPNLGSHLMTSNQTAGIDLPMKALIYEDKSGTTYLAYNDPKYIAKRHGIKDRDEFIGKMSKALDKITNAATKKAE